MKEKNHKTKSNRFRKEAIEAVEAYRKEMRETVIPEIITAVRRRETLAVEARWRRPLF